MNGVLALASSGEGLPMLVLVAGLVALGVAVQWISALLRIPSIVLLLVAGITVGPVTGWIRPGELMGELFEPFVGLSVALVLFEGGLSLRMSEARRLGAPLWWLVVGGLVVSFALTTLGGVMLADLSLPVAATIGAILVVTGPTVIKPMLRQASLARQPARLLRWEGIVNDPLGALLAVMVLEVTVVMSAPEGDSTATLMRVVGLALVAGVAGAGSGWMLGRALARGWVPEHLKTPVITAGVVLVFALTDAMLHESGLLAVTLMGVVLANGELVSLEVIRRFKEDVATLLVAMLFVLLAADLTVEDLSLVTPGAVLLVLAVVFVVRPASVWLATAPTSLAWQEKALLGWIAPRGIVAAAMAGALTPQLERAGHEDARLILPVLFGVIALTVVLHGLTIRPLARLLGLAGRPGGGLMMIGASLWSFDLARTLSEAGVDVFMADSDYRAVLRGRLRGVEAYHGDVLAEDTLDDLPLERVSCTLAATPDDHYNARVSLALRGVVEHERTLELTAPGEDESSPHLGGVAPWGEEGSFAAVSVRYWSGRRFRTTKLSEQFDGEAFMEHNPDALVLFVVGEDGSLAPHEAGRELPDEGRLVYMP